MFLFDLGQQSLVPPGIGCVFLDSSVDGGFVFVCLCLGFLVSGLFSTSRTLETESLN